MNYPKNRIGHIPKRLSTKPNGNNQNHCATVAFDPCSTSPFDIKDNIVPTFILRPFQDGELHAFFIYGKWKLDLAAEENRAILVRSQYRIHGNVRALQEYDVTGGQSLPNQSRRFVREEADDLVIDLILQYASHTFLMADCNRVVCYAITPEEAENLAVEFQLKYARPVPKPDNGTYVLIKITKDRLDTHSVSLKPDMRLVEDKLQTHYGENFPVWHMHFIRLLEKKSSGIAIFEGGPGTGKTSYIRHLIYELEKTHRFYFLPVSQLDILARPDFNDFWLTEMKLHPDLQFVIILEDAENALMLRGTDNARMVSTILNLTDGMMVDFLRLQFLCTVNCALSEIDPALLRPGRLLAHRNFRSLNRGEALTLAAQIGKTLPLQTEFTLAEIYAADAFQSLSTAKPNRPRVGFGG